ncbi:helix-turn-helix transcriptional regulator [Kitasatospora sp. NPDC093679]|uniref:helix-turn-helix transcriptional regulator n=1 Tax=Kitasatospora sp. NPDC093679 TaxID=3154983 RepID=UPI003422A2D3
MTEWARRTTGARIKALRGGSMTQEELAAAAELSVKTIQKVEQGRGDLSVRSLLRVAVALGTDVAVVTGQQEPTQGMELGERAALRAVSAAVHDSAMGLAAEGEPDPVEDLAAQGRRADAAFWSGRYTEVGAALSVLLPQARAAYDAACGAERERAAGVLADGYQTAAVLANVLGARDLGYAAITYGRQVAEQAGDDLRTAHLAASLSWIYLRDGHTGKGVAVAERYAGAIEPRMSDRDPDRLSVYGQLVTNAAVAASRGGGAAEAARDYLSQAHAVAARIGSEHARGGHNQPFGPSYAATQALSVAIALGDVGRAVRLIDTVRLDAALPLATRARFHLDVALTRTETRQWEAAGSALEKVCGMAPNWVAHQALFGAVVERMAAAVPGPRVNRIAARGGVTLGTR